MRAHGLDQRRRHGKGPLAAAQHHHLGDGGGQRQHQAEAGALAGRAGGLDAPAHGVDVGAHHVHAHAAAGQAGQAVRRGEARLEDQVGQRGVVGLFVGAHQALGPGLGQDAGQVQAGAVVAHLHAHLVAHLGDGQADGAGGVLAGAGTLGRRLDAVHHAVAQQVLEGRRHAVEHAAVDLDAAAPGCPAAPVCRFPWPPGAPRGTAAPTGLRTRPCGVRSRSSCMSRFMRRWWASASSVDCRVRCRPRCTVATSATDSAIIRVSSWKRGETVHLQRVEGLRSGAGGLLAGLDLGFGLQLDVAQLGAQALQVVAQVVQRALELLHVGFNARAGDAHFAGLVDQPVQQRRAHPHRPRRPPRPGPGRPPARRPPAAQQAGRSAASR